MTRGSSPIALRLPAGVARAVSEYACPEPLMRVTIVI
jgi:hypothetical protein